MKTPYVEFSIRIWANGETEPNDDGIDRLESIFRYHIQQQIGAEFPVEIEEN